MHVVTFRLWAAARAAAGVTTLTGQGNSLATALAGLETSAEFQRIVAASTILVDGRRVADLDAELTGPVEAEVLPPFAGG